jgi:peptidoglycan-N-acetylglucosamine deacetylase
LFTHAMRRAVWLLTVWVLFTSVWSDAVKVQAHSSLKLLSPLTDQGDSKPSFTAEQNKKRVKRSRKQSNSWVSLQKRFPGTFITGGPRNLRKVALTFDDVPDPRYTPQVLEILARYKVRATFFVVGSRASAYPTIVRRMRREGHIIGNHSYNHAVFSRISLASFQQQILKTDRILRPLAGYSPKLVRPPYGEILPRQIEWLKQNGFIVVNWDVDSVDWRSLDSSRILINIKKTLQPGSIVLQHAGGGVGQDLNGTIAALPRLIQLLRSKGYKIVTLPELIGRPQSRK